MKLNPYFDFDGNAEEAVLFYASVFEVKPDIMRFGDAPDHDPTLASNPTTKNKILHAHLLVDGTSLMFSDVPPGTTLTPGNNLALNLTTSDREKLEKWFLGLSAGANVVTPLSTTFWSPAYGYLIDRFGIGWMFNLDVEG